MHSLARLQGVGTSVQAVSPDELYQVIVDASSQDVSRIKASSERLQAMLQMFGSYDALQEIASRTAYPLPARQQAMIQFKNAVLGYWRSRKYLSDDHRTRIRQRSLLFVGEVDETIASCNEVVVAKIARIDYPDQWPDLTNQILKIIDTGLQNRYVAMLEDPKETLRLRRTLSLLNEILKEFSSIKLLGGVKVMSDIVEQLHMLLSNYYSKMSATFSESNMTPESIASQNMCDNISLSHLVYKCLVKMAVWFWGRIPRLTKDGFKPNQIWIEDFFRNSAVQLSTLAILRKKIVLSMLQSDFMRNDQTLRTVVALTRHLRVFGKFFRRLQCHSAERFMTLPTSEDLILFYWSDVIDCSNHPQDMLADSDEALFPLRFIVQGMAIFKESLSQWTPRRKNGISNKRNLSQEFVENSVRVLVTRFLPLNASDLESWMSDPEEWVSTEEKENARWEFEIRACAEHVIVQLSSHFPDFVIPLLATTFERSAPQPCADLDAVLQKEALYCAVGRCAFRLRDSLRFDSWVDVTFAPEAQSTDRNYPIIKRRIAWLLGKLVSEECSAPNNPKVWETLVHLLRDRGAGSDAVVRLTAATALRECVNGKDFVAETFAPFLPTTIAEFIQLMAEADSLESKRKVDESLNKVIERSGNFIIPFISVITEPIPHLWQAASNDYDFKVSLLRTVTRLAEAVGVDARILGPLVVPLVRESFVPNSSLMLDYDAVEMWYSTLKNTDTIFGSDGVPSLRELYPLLFHLMSTHGDILGLTLRIVDSSLLLDAPYILQTYAKELCRGYLDAIQTKAGDVHQIQVTQGLGLMTQLCPSSMWGEATHTSGLFPHLLKTLIAGEVQTELTLEHIYLFSRLLIADSRLFLQLVAAAAPILNQPETKLYDLILDKWWGKFDLISEPRYRKLTAMGIAALVGTGRLEVLQRFPEEIIELWADVFADMTDVPPTNEPITLAQMIDPDDEPGFVSGWDLTRPPKSYFRESEGTAEHARREALYTRDPICALRLVVYVREKLKEAESNCGAETLQHYLNSTNPETLGQFQKLFAQG